MLGCHELVNQAMNADEDIPDGYAASSRFAKVMMLELYVLLFMVPHIVFIYQTKLMT